MPQEFVIEPQIGADLIASLNKDVDRLDWILDKPYSGTQPISQSGILEKIGSMLWDASGLKENDVLDAIKGARDQQESVRIIVMGEKFHHLPWELLYHDNSKLGFMGCHPWCVVARRTQGSGDKTPQVTGMPLRILLFISSPEDLNPEKNRLDFEREEELLFTALNDPWANGEIDIDVAEDGYFKTLLDRLENNRYHAVIMSMHGVLARNSRGEEEWGLLFEDEDTGGSAPLAGSDIVAGLDRLSRGHRPGLVVLSACRSASAKETAKAIPSVTRRLHESGFERVLGMRLSILDQAASAFSAELFRRLAQGEVLGRAVNLARDQVAGGEWIGADKNPDRAGAVGDPYGQWSLPVLMDRTVDGPIVDREMPGEVIERPSPPSVLIGDGTIHVPQRSSFIGRRTETRLYLRAFLEGRRRCLMLTGPGGVGKTTLAGLFARNLMERQPETRLLGFRAPFDLGTIYEVLRWEAFDGTEEPALLSFIQTEPDIRKRISELLISLARRKRPCAFMLDNLEALQDISTLEVFPEHETSLWFLRTVCDLPSPTRVLLTGRYTLPGLPEGIVTQCPVPDAPYGDILWRMTRLELPRTMDVEKKRWIYRVLGGNHRAIEWAAQVLKDETNKACELVEALEKVEAPPETPEAAVRVVLDAMRQNLLLSAIRTNLTGKQDWLLRSLSLYRVPVNYDGLTAVSSHPEELTIDQQRLSDYALLEGAYAPGLDLEYFSVPSVVKELLKGGGFSTEELTQLHEAMGGYHRFQGRYLSRLWTDYLEAIYHFRRAGDHDSADELADGVSGFYHRFSNFADANRLTEEIVERSSPEPPWWALNRYGLCQLVLGSLDNALAAFERARPMAPTRKDEGATLNNISQIYHARGDYDTALKYLEESLEILREIGDKAGEGTTLNNISQIYRARGDYDTALKYLEESLEILREIGDKAGEGTTLNNISQIYRARGDYDTALKYLEESLEIRREIGDKAGEGTTLNNISQIYRARGDYDTALKYLEESLEILREIGDKAGEGTTLNNISQIYRARGDYDTALKYLEESLEILREIGDKAGEGTTLNNISQIYDARGDYDTALKYLEESLEILREIGDKAGEGATLNNISQIYRARGDYDTALKYLEESLEIRREIGDKAGMIPTLHNMGHIALEAEDPERAMGLWAEALSIALETGDATGIFHVAKTLGSVFVATGNNDDARKLLNLAVEVGSKAGFPQVQEVEAILGRLGRE